MSQPTQLSALQDDIRLRYDTLSKRLQQVAQYVLDNEHSIIFDTIATIAQHANVPPSTLIRFANAFGFNGFNEMKQLFRENLMENTQNYTERLQISRQLLEKGTQDEETAVEILAVFAQTNAIALQSLASHIDQQALHNAVEILNSANNIFIIGLKRSFSVACYLDYALHHLDCRSFVINGLGGMFDEQLSQVRAGDVVVAISFSPYAQETLNIMEVTAKKGVKQIAITDSQISPLLAFSDASFVIKEAQVKGFRSQCSTMTLVQTLAIALGLKKEKTQQ